jgi:hypothetical protein
MFPSSPIANGRRGKFGILPQDASSFTLWIQHTKIEPICPSVYSKNPRKLLGKEPNDMGVCNLPGVLNTSCQNKAVTSLKVIKLKTFF